MMKILACVTSSILISKANFITKASGERENKEEGSGKSVGGNVPMRGRNQGQ